MNSEFSDFKPSYESGRVKSYEEGAKVYKRLAEFHLKIVDPIVERLVPLLRDLMANQYPEVHKAAGESHLKEFDESAKMFIEQLTYALQEYCVEQMLKEDPKVKYTKLEEWREFYSQPEKLVLMDDSSRAKYQYLNDEEWEKLKAKDNEEERVHFEREQRLRQEWYDIVQPVLFEYLPQLNELEGDYWVLYSMSLRDRYEDWNDECRSLRKEVAK